MEAKVSILARVRKANGDGYDHLTMQQKKGRFIPIPEAVSFLIRYTHAGTRDRRTIRAGKTFDEAYARYLNIDRDQKLMREGKDPIESEPLEPVKKTGPLKVTEAIEQYLKWANDRVVEWRAGAKKGGLSPNSVVAYTKHLNDFLTYCKDFGIAYLPKTDETDQQDGDEINRKMLLEYKTYLYKNLPRRKGGQQSNTIANRFRSLNSFLGYHKIRLVQDRSFRDGRGLLMPTEMPRANKAGRNGAPDVRVYSKEELHAMFSVADTDEQDWLQFHLKLGVRDEERTHAEWTDIDWINCTIKIQDKLEKYGWRVKDKENRTLPIEAKLLRRLKARRSRQEQQASKEGRNTPSLLFPNTRGSVDQTPITALHKLTQKAREQMPDKAWPADFPDDLHTFRKNYATELNRAGYDIVSIQHLLGHSDLETTRGYIAPNPTAAATAVRTAFGAYGD